MGGPGWQIKGEFARNGFKQNNLRHTRGVLSICLLYTSGGGAQGGRGGRASEADLIPG